jgi:hypothetical protein
MSSPPQKLSKMTSMSFLGLSNRNIVNMIISHLSIDDIKALTLVSKEMNDFVSNSKVVMEKRMKLCIAESWTKEFEFKDVESSRRRYNVLEVNSLLRRKSEITKAIPFLSSSLTTISTTFDFDVEGVQLKLVKHLKMRMNHSRYLERGLLSAVKNLKSLRLEENLHGNPAIIIECLKANPGLKYLDLEGEVANILFSKMQSFQFDFELLVFRVNTNTNHSDDFHYMLKNFIRHQPSIRELKLVAIQFHNLATILSYCHDLEKLTYSSGFKNQWVQYGGANIPVLSSMKVLNLISDHKFNGPLRILLSRMPKLRKLYFALPDREIMKTILRERSMLQEISYAFFEDETDPEDIAQMRIHSFNKNVVIKQI